MIGAIQNISFRGIQNINKPLSFKGVLPWYLTQALKGDTFVKSSEGPQIDYEKMKKEIPNDFVDWAKKNNFINDGLKKSLKPENLIGEGFDHAVFNIPNNPDYVLRIKRGYYGKTDNFDFKNYTIKDTRDMELQGNIGQQIALLENIPDKKNGKFVNPDIEVLKRQHGFPNGNPPPSALYHGDGTLREEVLPYEDNSRKLHFAKSMETLANFPDETYDQLIDDLLIAGEAGYKFDHLNSNNFLIDEDEKRINIIDMSKVKKPHKDRFGNTLWSLINVEFLNEYMSKESGYTPQSQNEINDTIKNMLTVMDKYSAAMKRKIQKFNTSSYHFNLLLNEPISSFWLKECDYDKKVDKLREMGLLYEGNKNN